MLNQTILTGNLGQDPEIHYSNQGDPIARFSMAFKSSKDKTGWIKVVCFKKTAELVEKYLHKGARIGIIGTLDENIWQTDEGVEKRSFQLIGHSVEFIKTDGRGFENQGTPF